jgi:hypothetical protein
MGPASQTRLVACSERPSCNKNGVPHLSAKLGNYILARPVSISPYPSSMVQIICAPAIEMLKATRSMVDMCFLAARPSSVPLDPRRPLGPGGAVGPSLSDGMDSVRMMGRGARNPCGSGELGCDLRPAGHGIWPGYGMRRLPTVKDVTVPARSGPRHWRSQLP